MPADDLEALVPPPVPLYWRAEIARCGAHHQPWWSPDTDSYVDDLDDRDTRNAVRALLARMLNAEEPRRG